MAKEKLVELKPGKGLDSGLFPSAQPSVGAPWRMGTNAWFREMDIRHALGRQKLVNTNAPSKALAQAYVAGKARVYYEELGFVRYFESGSPQLVGALEPSGSFDLEPYGAWLLATDGTEAGLQLWKGAGALEPIADALTQFKTCKIVKRLAQHVLVYCTDTFPTGFHWSSASNAELWTPASGNSAGNLPVRDLDSDIMAVANLGAAHAVYSQNNMLIVQYTGRGTWFGTPNQGVSGIGAVSRDAVVSLGRYNWGLGKGGIWLTEGSTMMYVDRPAVDRWLQENVDWSRADEVTGFFNDKLHLICWTVPLLTGGRTVIAVDPKNKTSLVDTGQRTFTYLDAGLFLGIDRTVFDNPLSAREDGIYLESIATAVSGGFELSSQLFDGGANSVEKVWDHFIFEGELSGEIRVGFTNATDLSTLEWEPWQQLSEQVPLLGRASTYVAFELRSEAQLKINAITIFGELAGSVT